MSKFLLLLGPSGVGKSSIIEELLQLDSRFVYISPFMTRALREGEKNKISISGEEMDKMWNRGELLVINELYGIRYATPRLPIVQALAQGNFPVLDWPISRIEAITAGVSKSALHRICLTAFNRSLTATIGQRRKRRRRTSLAKRA